MLCRLLIKSKLLWLFVAGLEFTGSAFGEVVKSSCLNYYRMGGYGVDFEKQCCPDTQGSYHFPLGHSGEESRRSKRVDYWIVPTKIVVAKINGKQTINNLSENYIIKNKPSFTCYGTFRWVGVYTCETSAGVSYDQRQIMPYMDIPAKDGNIVPVELNYIAESGSTSCNQKYSKRYVLYGLGDISKSYPYPKLPYLLLSRISVPIKVQTSGSAPSF